MLPDYADPANWLALPGRLDAADLIPAGDTDRPDSGRDDVDVFFLHPTGYSGGEQWRSPLVGDHTTERNWQWSMAYQASLFNSCCRVFAPRFREATVQSYLVDSTEARDAILEGAYQDVEAAFDFFIDNLNEGRPFIIASHSQGTHHALKLIQRRIDGTPTAHRFIVGYTLGATLIGVTPADLEKLGEIGVCENARDTGCIVHWDTLAEGGSGIPQAKDSLCINPLTWLRDGERAPRHIHGGGLRVRHPYIRAFTLPELASYGAIEQLGPIESELTGARCENNILRVDRLDPGKFIDLNTDGNYHVLDFTLFYDDIRRNARNRIRAFTNRPREPLLKNGRPAAVPRSPAEWQQLVDAMAGARDISPPVLEKAFDVRITRNLIGDVNVFRIRPTGVRAKDNEALVLHFHGGAYVFNEGVVGAAEGAMVASYSRLPVWAVDYRMPPGNPFPAALDDAVKVYRAACKAVSCRRVALAGTSAGGGLAAAVVQRIIADGGEAPAVLALGSPWVDLTRTGDTLTTLEGLDTVLSAYEPFLAAAAELYADGLPLASAAVSPIYGEFAGFPPTYLVTGTRDLFLSDTARLHRKLKLAGVETDFNVYERMVHAGYRINTESIESQQVYLEMADFLRRHLGLTGD